MQTGYCDECGGKLTLYVVGVCSDCGHLLTGEDPERDEAAWSLLALCCALRLWPR